MNKRARLLWEHIARFGLMRGIRLVWLKSSTSTGTASISSPVTGGRVKVRPGTSDMAIYDQIVLHPYLPTDRAYESILDLGANIGLTVRYWKAALPEAIIVAVEPDPANFELLEANTGHLPDVHCVRAGIWHTAGTLSIARDGSGNSAFRTMESEKNEVAAVTIAMIMERFGLDRIGLVKIDIEGAELELFSKGELGWIDRVEAIAIELHDQWKPGCGDAFFAAISKYDWSYSIHGEMILCERRPSTWSRT